MLKAAGGPGSADLAGKVAASALSQTAFARAFRINVGRLRDLEQGRATADSALLAYLGIIDREPDPVRRALG